MLKEGLNTKYITKLFKHLMQPKERVIYATTFLSTIPGIEERTKHSVKKHKNKKIAKIQQRL
jgi:hypothetical protein